MNKYYVAYYYQRNDGKKDGLGASTIETEGSMRYEEEIDGVVDLIKKENDFHSIVILNWKKLK